jgi:hypothetical protein
VVHREDRHRGVHRAVGERQGGGRRADRRDALGRPLAGHHVARLDRQHVQIRGLVRAAAGADVDDAAGGAQRGADASREARVFAAVAGVAAP